MQNCGFGWQNRVLDATLVASNTTVGSLPVTNLQNPYGAASLGFRSLIEKAGDSANFTMTLPAAATWRVFSLHRTNLRETGAQWRIQVSNGGTSVVDTYVMACPVSGGQCVWALPNDVTGDAVTITVWPRTDPGTWIDIPLAYAGPLWSPVRNFSSESTADRVLGQDSVVSLGGQEFVATRWYQRKLTIAHQSLGDADAPVVEQMLRVAATGRNILFLPDPSADALTLAQRGLFGRLSGGEISNPFGAADRHAITLDLTERL
ncbi:hypothetical protein J2D73_17270 [Acetobacter sacchari]|uniref:Uncharacterized protein n=1 Tax=Acetobacter sacchari TaxID=2661687 RepID=A0ABS3M045_9PROT|nr:hypothetical protein [Acetobacter sacchari]MBO1361539.1 hypothetical protein [Acetobacter sacchari]